AFDLARRAVSNLPASRVVDWLEDVMRTLAPVQATVAPAGAAADDLVFFAPGDACWRHLVHRIAQTRRTMDLCVFTITDDRVSHPILDAHRRGVKIRIVTDDDKARDPGSDVVKFQAAGIPVKFDDVHGPATSGLSGHMHHKFAVFDDTRLVNGSYNWTRGAAEANYENLTESVDPKLVAAFSAEFERLWKKF
ncbi:MAG TPA: phospholipase D-like domain-containing protein, partial [Urbifossiella sp.]|nr:phospholipase D-like domain-containing protein [Urbifossiella sp.]